MNGVLTELIDAAGVIKAKLRVAGTRANRGKTAAAVAEIETLRQRIVEMATRLRKLRANAEVMADTATAAFSSLDMALKQAAAETGNKRTGGTVLHELSSVPAGLADSASTFIIAQGCVPFPQTPVSQN